MKLSDGVSWNLPHWVGEEENGEMWDRNGEKKEVKSVVGGGKGSRGERKREGRGENHLKLSAVAEKKKERAKGE